MAADPVRDCAKGQSAIYGENPSPLNRFLPFLVMLRNEQKNTFADVKKIFYTETHRNR